MKYNNVEIIVSDVELELKNVIYKLTFPNNKQYIGQTIQPLKKRIYKHCWDSFDNTRQDYTTKKSRAIRKYMEFSVEVLYQGEDLDIEEIKFIKEFDCLDNGYNCDEGGKGSKGFKHTEECKQKMSECWKGKLSGENNPNFGNTMTDENRLKISKANSKSIIITNIITNEIKEFDSIKDASIFYNVSHSTISKVITGVNKKFSKQYIATCKNNNNGKF